MRISELAQLTGVPTATLKYYRREGLLHPGEAVNRTQADYDASHVARVRLIRALIEHGRLSISAVKAVVAALEDPPGDWHDLLGTAQEALVGRACAEDGAPTPRADALITRADWRIDPASPLRPILEEQLSAAQDAAVAVPEDLLMRYADAMHEVAAADISTLPGTLEGAIRQVVVATAMIDPILVTLRRLAQQDLSARRFADDDGDPG